MGGRRASACHSNTASPLGFFFFFFNNCFPEIKATRDKIHPSNVRSAFSTFMKCAAVTTVILESVTRQVHGSWPPLAVTPLVSPFLSSSPLPFTEPAEATPLTFRGSGPSRPRRPHCAPRRVLGRSFLFLFSCPACLIHLGLPESSPRLTSPASVRHSTALCPFVSADGRRGPPGCGARPPALACKAVLRLPIPERMAVFQPWRARHVTGLWREAEKTHSRISSRFIVW